ncbi:MAG: glutathione peroxidase [Spirochaetales bacterium]|nr:glutathione peroxidase [Spirochaetales bacterium]MBQ2124480.1 glutathione peroxidase [Spirochaetales bacterium]MBQ2293848.1 glutathione peroxidase [Spirochaetales bacterium]
MTVYDFSVKAINGEIKSLKDYEGKVLLIVNTATKCGFTSQYEALQDLYEKYHDDGLEILDFPCNQFAHQAPGNNDEIHTFCRIKYAITFSQFSKINVNGRKEEPLYKYLKSEKKGAIKWNFTKFLVDSEGKVVNRFAPSDTPEKIEPFIKKALQKKTTYFCE